VRFEVLTVVNVKNAVLWGVMLCSLLEGHQCFGGTCCFHLRVQDEGRQQAPVKCWYLYTRLHGITSQKTVIFNTIIVQD